MGCPEYLLIYIIYTCAHVLCISGYEIINENICVHMDAGFISDM